RRIDRLGQEREQQEQRSHGSNYNRMASPTSASPTTTSHRLIEPGALDHTAPPSPHTPSAAPFARSTAAATCAWAANEVATAARRTSQPPANMTRDAVSTTRESKDNV